jgi:diadenosine tetraphosphate (Ap4A) HIT family hydrolase
MSYDTNNVFAKILRGEMPCRKVYEDDFALAIHDISPAAPTHILVMPKGAYVSFADFMARAAQAEIHGFFAAVAKVAQQENGEADFRLISNNGATAGQTVFHFHVHILAGTVMHALLGD